MKLLIALLLLMTAAGAQTPAVTTPSVPQGTLSDALNIDPTADTDNPTLLKAQILILQSAREAKRAVLAQLSDFQDFEKYDALASQKQQKLTSIVQSKAAQERAVEDRKKTAAHLSEDKAKQDAEIKALAEKNDKAKTEKK
jgi:hypothetical protein